MTVREASQPDAGRILVVDDSGMNRMLLQRALESEGHTAVTAVDGRDALAILESDATGFDAVLLDILMPALDGYETLAAIKATPATSHLPVIVISDVDDAASVVRCIEIGATDYLTKPFNRSILHARVNASLAQKRLRDLELEYLEQVGRVTEAAVTLEQGTWEAGSLDGVAQRSDALGLLARTFRRMAAEVRAREDRLRREVLELRIEIDEARQARQVAEITDTDYFRHLRSRASELRGIVAAEPRGRGEGGDG
jgi:two-component system cell cycle response regulator